MGLDLYDLEGPDGEDNDGGFKTIVWVAPERDFLKTLGITTGLKGPKLTTDPGDSVTIDGSHEFETGKGFTKLYSTLDSGELKLDPVGERDGRSLKGSIELFHPGNKKEAAEAVRRLKNLPSILIVEEQDGTKVQLGSLGLGVELVPAYSSGKVSGGRRGWILKGEWYANSQYFYEGDIVRKTVVV